MFDPTPPLLGHATACPKWAAGLGHPMGCPNGLGYLNRGKNSANRYRVLFHPSLTNTNHLSNGGVIKITMNISNGSRVSTTILSARQRNINEYLITL
jgi:hypothetical protein